MSEYWGFLRPWLAEMTRWHLAGVPLSEITKRLQPLVRKRHPDMGKHSFDDGVVFYIDYPQREHVKYALRRIGFLPVVKRPSKVHHTKWKQNKEMIRNWRIAAGLEIRLEVKPTLGRPIDMGGPRDIWIDRAPWDEL